MIQRHACLGVRRVTSNPGEPIESKLVAWCLTYDSGALGMLYTLEVFV